MQLGLFPEPIFYHSHADEGYFGLHTYTIVTHYPLSRTGGKIPLYAVGITVRTKTVVFLDDTSVTVIRLRMQRSQARASGLPQDQVVKASKIRNADAVGTGKR